MYKKNHLVEDLTKRVAKWKDKNYPAATILTLIKEYFQTYILDWIYNLSEYSYFIMFGGTFLRFAFDDFNRLSEDLDFVIIDPIELTTFADSIVSFFKTEFGIEVTYSRIRQKGNTSNLILTFPNLLRRLKLNYPKTALKIRVDITVFKEASNFALAHYPAEKYNKFITIKSFRMPALMSGKISAILYIREFWKGKKRSTAQPRDIYDLIWYMERQVIPDLEYIKTQGFSYNALADVFTDLEQKVLNLDDSIFADDLGYLFVDFNEYENWYKDWKLRAKALFKKYRTLIPAS